MSTYGTGVYGAGVYGSSGTVLSATSALVVWGFSFRSVAPDGTVKQLMPDAKLGKQSQTDGALGKLLQVNGALHQVLNVDGTVSRVT